MYQEKNILDTLKEIRCDIKSIEDILDDPKFGLKEIKKEIRDIEKKLDKEFDKDHDKDDDKKNDKDHDKDDDKKHDKDHGKDNDKKHGFKDWKKHFFCVGNVTVLMRNNLVFTGNLINDGDMDGCFKRKDEVEFLTLRLTAPLLSQPGSGDPAQIQPYYVPGDTVKLVVGAIETIGPSHVFYDAVNPTVIPPSQF